MQRQKSNVHFPYTNHGRGNHLPDSTEKLNFQVPRAQTQTAPIMATSEKKGR